MPLTKKIQELVDAISNYRQELLGEVSSLNESQLDYKPESDGWSLGIILHHLALTDEANLKLMFRALRHAEERNIPEDPTPDESALNGLERFADVLRTTKAKAPAFVEPQSHLSAEESIARLKASREKMIESIERLGRYDLSQLKYAHPLLGELDMYQWILIAGGHERRHVAQIRRIKAEAGFPAN
jgi:DinB family protein